MILKQKYSISKGTLKLFPYNSKDIMIGGIFTVERFPVDNNKQS